MDYSSQLGLSLFTGRKMMVLLYVLLVLSSIATTSVDAENKSDTKTSKKNSEASKSELSKRQDAQRREHSLNSDGSVNYHGSGSGHDSGDLIPPGNGGGFGGSGIDVSFGHPGSLGLGLSNSYGAPIPSNSYGPPQNSYLPPSKPKVPKPVYGPPSGGHSNFPSSKVVHRPPKPQYGPPHSPKPTYSVPNSHGHSSKPSFRPKPVYGPPSSSFGTLLTPVQSSFGPTASEVKYDGWKPIPGPVVQQSVSGSYGAPDLGGGGGITSFGSGSGFDSLSPTTIFIGSTHSSDNSFFGGGSLPSFASVTPLLPSNSYGPPTGPSPSYGTPLQPSVSYGPPDINFASAPPKPVYGVPSRPSGKYGPPKRPSSSGGNSHISHGSHKRPHSFSKRPVTFLGPPKPPSISYGPPKPPSSSYGPPSSRPPSGSYGPPPSRPPSGSYGPPPSRPPSGSYGPPPPRPPSGSYGPPPSRPPSASYGPPKRPSGSYGPPKPPSSSYGPPKPPSNSYGPPTGGSFFPPGPPSGSYGPPEHFTTYTVPKPSLAISSGQSSSYKGSSVSEHLHPPSFGQGQGLYKSPLPPDALYGTPSGFGSVNCCSPPAVGISSTYGVPQGDSHGPTAPSVSIIPSQSYGVPSGPNNQLVTRPGDDKHILPTSLPINQPKKPIKFRPPVPPGLISSIGSKWGDSSVWGGNNLAHNYEGNTYIPPAVPDPDPGADPSKGNSIVLPTPGGQSGQYGPPAEDYHHLQISSQFQTSGSGNSLNSNLNPPPSPPTGHSNYDVQPSIPVELPNVQYQIQSGSEHNQYSSDSTAYNSPNVVQNYQDTGSYSTISPTAQSYTQGIETIPIQGAQGSYTLQIQPAGGNHAEPVPHGEVLSNGLLQNILSVIENSGDSAHLSQYGSQGSDPIADEIGKNVLQQLGGVVTQESYGYQLPTQYEKDLAHASSDNVEEYSRASETNTKTGGTNTTSGNIADYLNRNNIAFYYNHQGQVGDVTSSDTSSVQNSVPSSTISPVYRGNKFENMVTLKSFHSKSNDSTEFWAPTTRPTTIPVS